MSYERHPADPTVAFGRRPDGTDFLYVPGELITDGNDDAGASRLENLGAEESTERPLPEPDKRAVRAQRAAFLPRYETDGTPITWTSKRNERTTHRPGLGRLSRESQSDAEPALQGLNRRRWFLPNGKDTMDALDVLRQQKVNAQPNHVFALQPWWFGTPDTLPIPDEAFGPPPSGQGTMSVTVLDTGIRPGWSKDDWFASRVDAETDDEELLDFDEDGHRDPQAGHGTFIAGVVAHRAPDAKVKARRLLSSFGLTTDVLLGIRLHQLASSINGGVLSLSLGGYTFDDQPPKLLSAALRRLDSDTVVVAAAGNNSSYRPFYPGASDDVIAVGSVRDGDERVRSTFSNFGEWVNCYAVGEDVHSTMIIHDGPVIGSPDSDNFQGYARWSGTSFAAPRVAAAIAQRSVDKGVPPRQAFDELIAEASSGDPGPIID